MAENLDTDVCVVGAGYAGLTAARRLGEAGVSVVVLEARPRVGGRIWTEHLDDGTPIDRGGAWLAPYHDAIFRLASEVGVSTYKTWVEGAHLLRGDGRIRRYRGLIPKISPRAVLAIARAQARVDRLARRVPLDAPWRARHAAEWDNQSVASFLDRTRIRSPVGRDLFEMAVRGLFAADLDDVSFLHLLFLAHSHRSISKLFSIDGGAQENLVAGGAGLIAERIADALGSAVRLGAPVRSIDQTSDRVVVSGDELTVSARRAIVTIPLSLVPDVAFDPPLPPDRLALCRRATAGHETKTLVVYDEPFWRADGLSGQTAGPGTAAEVTIDASPPGGSPGVLASFTFGRVAERFDRQAPDQRREAVLDALTERLGAHAGSPTTVIETAWWDEQWSRGCSFAHLAPGLLTRYGHLLREPVGCLHWAGTETAEVSHGAIDGAVRSGERAAREVLARL